MCVHTLIFHTYLGQLCTLRLCANYATGTFSTEKETTGTSQKPRALMRLCLADDN